MYQLQSFLGLFVFMFLAWCMSSSRKLIPWRVVIGGLLLQFVMGFLILKTYAGQWFFGKLSDVINALLNSVDSGSSFLFGASYQEHYFAFRVLPTIIFFSSLMSVLYHFGILQRVVSFMAWIMQKALGTSGAETLAAAVNVFVGQTEAPLLVKPYVPTMTKSEIMAVMVGGFANIAGGVLAAYVGMGMSAKHLLASSVISAPASLLIAKLMQPEVETPKTLGSVECEVKIESVNFLDALSAGASEGLMLALNVGAMLIAFLSLIAGLDMLLIWTSSLWGGSLNLSQILGFLFSPLAFFLGVPWVDCSSVGELLGLKMIANEFVAYDKLGTWLKPESTVQLGERSIVLATYALCGFANIGSIGIQIGGLSPLAPSKRGIISSLAFRAMLGGTIATFMTACIAGLFL